MGPGPYRLMVVGEAPGDNEDKVGEPWVGASGRKLRWVLAEAGVHSYVLTNSVRHHPALNRDPTDAEISNCQIWLENDIDFYEPVLILAMGKIAEKALSKIRLRRPIPPVIYCIHPAATLRNPRYHEKLWDTVMAAGKMVGATPVKTRVTFPLTRPEPPPRALLSVAQPQGLVVAADIETEGDDNNGAMVGYSISDGHTKTWIPADRGPRIWPYSHTIMHGATFDAPSLGIDLFLDSWDCTLLEAYVLRYPELGLKILGPRLTGIPMITYADLMKKAGVHRGHNFRKALESIPDEAIEYATTDSEATYWLHMALSQDPRWGEGRLRWRYDNIEKPVAAILSEMQQRGVLIDVDALGSLSARLSQITDSHEQWLSERFGEPINTRSPKLGELLNAGLILDHPLPRSEKGNVQADKQQLLRISGYDAWDGAGGLQEVGDAGGLGDGPAAVAYHILAAREARTLNATYCVGLPQRADAEGYIHAQWKQTVVQTNRLASGDPNLQNISSRSELGKPIRKAFIVPEGYVWIRADFSQVEVRLFAHLTQDPALVKCYPWGEPSIDVHDRVATTLGISRKPAKNGLFETIYGGSPEKFARTVGVAPERAHDFHAQLLSEFPSIATWAKDTEGLLMEQGYLETLLGHRMYFPTAWSPVPSERAEALRSAANARVQGSAADIMKLFMIDAYDLCKKHGAWFLVQVHDELGIACPVSEVEEVEQGLHRIVNDIARGLNLLVPLELSVGHASNWSDAS